MKIAVFCTAVLALASSTAIAQKSVSVPLTLTDSKWGYSLSVPSGWRYTIRAGLNPQNQRGPGTCIDLFPEGQNPVITVCGRPKRTNMNAIDSELRASVNSHLTQYGNFYSGFSLRPGSEQTRHVAERAALSAVFDYSSASQAFIEYMTWVQSEALRVNIAVRTPRDADQLMIRKDLEAVISSVRLP
jgi:hypothetical protein